MATPSSGSRALWIIWLLLWHTAVASAKQGPAEQAQPTSQPGGGGDSQCTDQNCATAAVEHVEATPGAAEAGVLHAFVMQSNFAGFREKMRFLDLQENHQVLLNALQAVDDKGLTIAHLLACSGRADELTLVTQAVHKLQLAWPAQAGVFKQVALESISNNASCTNCGLDTRTQVLAHLRWELQQPAQVVFLYGNVTPLECAAAHGHVQVMKQLVQRGVTAGKALAVAQYMRLENQLFEAIELAKAEGPLGAVLSPDLPTKPDGPLRTPRQRRSEPKRPRTKAKTAAAQGSAAPRQQGGSAGNNNSSSSASSWPSGASQPAATAAAAASASLPTGAAQEQQQQQQQQQPLQPATGDCGTQPLRMTPVAVGVGPGGPAASIGSVATSLLAARAKAPTEPNKPVSTPSQLSDAMDVTALWLLSIMLLFPAWSTLCLVWRRMVKRRQQIQDSVNRVRMAVLAVASPFSKREPSGSAQQQQQQQQQGRPPAGTATAAAGGGAAQDASRKVQGAGAGGGGGGPSTPRQRKPGMPSISAGLVAKGMLAAGGGGSGGIMRALSAPETSFKAQLNALAGGPRAAAGTGADASLPPAAKPVRRQASTTAAMVAAMAATEAGASSGGASSGGASSSSTASRLARVSGEAPAPSPLRRQSSRGTSALAAAAAVAAGTSAPSSTSSTAPVPAGKQQAGPASDSSSNAAGAAGDAAAAATKQQDRGKASSEAAPTSSSNSNNKAADKAAAASRSTSAKGKAATAAAAPAAAKEPTRAATPTTGAASSKRSSSSGNDGATSRTSQAQAPAGAGASSSTAALPKQAQVLAKAGKPTDKGRSSSGSGANKHRTASPAPEAAAAGAAAGAAAAGGGAAGLKQGPPGTAPQGGRGGVRVLPARQAAAATASSSTRSSPSPRPAHHAGRSEGAAPSSNAPRVPAAAAAAAPGAEGGSTAHAHTAAKPASKELDDICATSRDQDRRLAAGPAAAASQAPAGTPAQQQPRNAWSAAAAAARAAAAATSGPSSAAPTGSQDGHGNSRGSSNDRASQQAEPGSSPAPAAASQAVKDGDSSRRAAPGTAAAHAATAQDPGLASLQLPPSLLSPGVATPGRSPSGGLGRSVSAVESRMLTDLANAVADVFAEQVKAGSQSGSSQASPSQPGGSAGGGGAGGGAALGSPAATAWSEARTSDPGQAPASSGSERPAAGLLGHHRLLDPALEQGLGGSPHAAAAAAQGDGSSGQASGATTAAGAASSSLCTPHDPEVTSFNAFGNSLFGDLGASLLPPRTALVQNQQAQQQQQVLAPASAPVSSGWAPAAMDAAVSAGLQAFGGPSGAASAVAPGLSAGPGGGGMPVSGAQLEVPLQHQQLVQLQGAAAGGPQGLPGAAVSLPQGMVVVGSPPVQGPGMVQQMQQQAQHHQQAQQQQHRLVMVVPAQHHMAAHGGMAGGPGAPCIIQLPVHQQVAGVQAMGAAAGGPPGAPSVMLAPHGGMLIQQQQPQQQRLVLVQQLGPQQPQQVLLVPQGMGGAPMMATTGPPHPQQQAQLVCLQGPMQQAPMMPAMGPPADELVQVKVQLPGRGIQDMLVPRSVLAQGTAVHVQPQMQRVQQQQQQQQLRTSMAYVGGGSPGIMMNMPRTAGPGAPTVMLGGGGGGGAAPGGPASALQTAVLAGRVHGSPAHGLGVQQQQQTQTQPKQGGDTGVYVHWAGIPSSHPSAAGADGEGAAGAAARGGAADAPPAEAAAGGAAGSAAPPGARGDQGAAAQGQPSESAQMAAELDELLHQAHQVVGWSSLPKASEGQGTPDRGSDASTAALSSSPGRLFAP